MTVDEVLRDVQALKADLENYECKYGLPSETFYQAYRAGEEVGGKLPPGRGLGAGLE